MKNTQNNILPFPEELEKRKKKLSILEDFEAINVGKRIKLRTRPVPTRQYPNKQSLYLDISRYNKRERRYLKIYLEMGRNTRSKDKEELKKAIEVRDQLELEFFQNEHGFRLYNHAGKSNMLDFFKSITDKKTGGSYKPYLNTYKHLVKFTKGEISFNQVDRKFCNDFKEYLLQRVSQNAAHTYFARLKAVLNQAIYKEIITANPAKFCQIKTEEVQKEFLTIKELRKLKDTPCYNQQTKNAFLFSCYTGLRYSDIDNLRFEDIVDGYLRFRQKKTKGYERIKLSKSALEIVGIQKEGGIKEGKIFHLLYPTTTIVHIQQWVRDAGITKHITWHSGRHTFATMALSSGVDLYTVSKLLGHREIRTTQIYAKLIDKKKDEAVDKLPFI